MNRKPLALGNKKITKRELTNLKKKIIPILKHNNVVRASIFGSFVRGEAKKKSDIDILIEVKAKKFSLFDLVGIKLELENKLKRKVDVLTYNSIHPALRDIILKEEVSIYEKK